MCLYIITDKLTHTPSYFYLHGIRTKSHLMEAAVLALAEDHQCQAVSADAEDPDPDQQNPFDPELSRDKDRMVDGEVLVAAEVLVRLDKLVRLVGRVHRGSVEDHGHGDARKTEPEPEKKRQKQDFDPDGESLRRAGV